MNALNGSYTPTRTCCRYRQDGSTLMVTHVVPADEGDYQCVATNMAGRRVSQVALLTVYGEWQE